MKIGERRAVAFTTLMTAETLVEHLGDPRWVIIDCRFSLADPSQGERDYAAGHIPGARYAHLDHDLSSPVTPTSGRHPLPAPEVFARTAGGWGIGPATQVIAYDDAAGMFAARLWWLLRWLGHETAAVLDGGWRAWLRAGFPVTAERPQITPETFTPRPDDSRWLRTEEVLDIVHGTRAGLIVDARAPARYAGTEETIDPVAGHIPGAYNRPWMDNVDSEGRFRSRDNLRARFEAFGVPPGGIVHMCGSGVTACHNVLAMEHAGLRGSRLYAGSWSEWIRDPHRPVARGEEP